MRSLILFSVLLIFVAPTVAQEKVESQRVGSYSIRSRKQEELVAKTHAFIETIKTSRPNLKGVIFVYPEFKFEGDCVDGKIIADLSTEELVRDILSVHTELKPDQIRIERGETYFGTVQFWLVPEGAASPKQETCCVDLPCCCRYFVIIGRSIAEFGTRKLKYTLNTSGNRLPTDIIWATSVGKIISGQGSREIIVEIDGNRVDEIRVALRYAPTGNPACNCPVGAEFTTTFQKN